MRAQSTRTHKARPLPDARRFYMRDEKKRGRLSFDSARVLGSLHCIVLTPNCGGSRTCNHNRLVQRRVSYPTTTTTTTTTRLHLKRFFCPYLLLIVCQDGTTRDALLLVIVSCRVAGCVELSSPASRGQALKPPEIGIATTLILHLVP